MMFIFFLVLLLATFDTTEAFFFTKSDQPAELYANELDGDLTKTFTTAISKANKSVLLIMYSLTDPQIIECLIKKSQKGIPVKVICDAKASPYIDTKLGPKIDVTRRFGPGLMHQKILVIDNTKTWIGSANMTTESLCSDGNLVTYINNKLLAEMIDAKAKSVDIEGRGPPFLHEEFTVGGQTLEMWFLPDDKEALLRLKTLIRGAQKSVSVAMYTWTQRDLAKEVAAASKRGVITKVVIDNASAQSTSKKIVDYLKNSGVDITLSPSGQTLHHKFMVIDENILVNGSANWTGAAFNQNDDCFVIINDLTKTQRKKINAVWNKICKNAEKP